MYLGWEADAGACDIDSVIANSGCNDSATCENEQGYGEESCGEYVNALPFFNSATTEAGAAYAQAAEFHREDGGGGERSEIGGVEG